VPLPDPVVGRPIPAPTPSLAPEDVVDPGVSAFAPSPRVAPAAIAGEVGYLNVTATQRGLPVLLDGTQIGQTTLVRLEVAVGDYEVTVPGYNCAPRLIELRRSQVVNVACK
ncbi:MAG: PEGA domain-containing protein, partial [Myxococcota bacterium]